MVRTGREEGIIIFGFFPLLFQCMFDQVIVLTAHQFCYPASDEVIMLYWKIMLISTTARIGYFHRAIRY